MLEQSLSAIFGHQNKEQADSNMMKRVYLMLVMRRSMPGFTKRNKKRKSCGSFCQGIRAHGGLRKSKSKDRISIHDRPHMNHNLATSKGI